MKKRILALLSAVCMLASLCLTPAFAEENEQSQTEIVTEQPMDATGSQETASTPTEDDAAIPSVDEESGAPADATTLPDDAATPPDSAENSGKDAPAQPDAAPAQPDALAEGDTSTGPDAATPENADPESQVAPLAADNDVTPPVFEDVKVRYDAESNKLYFDVQAYDAESETWNIRVCFLDSEMVQYCTNTLTTSNNPCTLEYDASQLQNGEYCLHFVEVNDGTNRVTIYFESNGVVTDREALRFNVTNSTYVKAFTLKDVKPSVSEITLGKGEVKNYNVVVELNGDISNLVKDPNHNDRIGTICYNSACEADLFLNDQGQIVGTCSVDWLILSGDLQVGTVNINTSKGNGIYPEAIYNSSSTNKYGTIHFVNTVDYNDRLPIASLTVVDKATGESVNEQTFDIANGQQGTLVCTLRLKEAVELPEGVTLEAWSYPQNSSNSLVCFNLSKDPTDPKVYTGSQDLNAFSWSTQYVVLGIGAHRGASGYQVAAVPGIAPHFIVKTGDNVVINTHTTTVNVFINGNTVYNNDVTVEGYTAMSLQDLMGGAENYSKLVAQTKREKGDTCEGWYLNNTFYAKDDIVPSDPTAYITPAYANYIVTPAIYFVGENMELCQVKMAEREVARGTTWEDVFTQCQNESTFPNDLPKLDGITFTTWGNTYHNSITFDGLLQYRACYNKDWKASGLYTVTAGESRLFYDYNTRCYFYDNDDNSTVADYIDRLPAPSTVPAGYKFHSWEIVSGSTYSYWDYDAQKSVTEIWTRDVLLSKASDPAPDVYATYEKIDPNAPDLPEPPSYQSPDDPTPPTPDEPKGVTLPEEVVNTKVTEIEKAVEDAKTSGEKPAPIHIDMKTESSEQGAVATVIPVEVLEAIQDTDVDVVLDMGDYSWTVSGQDVAAVNLKDVDLEVKLVEDAIPSETVNTLAGGAETQQITLTHNGNFGFRAELTINLGKDKVDKQGSLYYYNSNHQLVFMDAGLVDKDGNITLSFSHASDYVVVFDKDLARVPGDLNGDGEVNTDDVERMKMCILRLCDPMKTEDLDFTGDGKVDIFDVVQLQMYIAKLTSEPFAKP